MKRVLLWLQEYAAEAGLPNNLFIALVAAMVAWGITKALREAVGT